MAWRSLRRTPGLTLVMIIALSLGIGTWYAQHQVYGYFEAKRVPARRDVFLVALERGDVPTSASFRMMPLLPSILLSERDARALLDGASPAGGTLTFAASAVLEPDGRPPEAVRVRYTTRHLFDLFGIPLAEGSPWSANADAGEVIEGVLDARLARRLFGAGSAVGKRVRVDGAVVQVTGVVSSAHASRLRLYDFRTYDEPPEGLYLPVVQAAAAHAVADFEHVVAAGETGSALLWVELRTPDERATFVAHAEAHLARERAAGRTETPRAVTLRSAEAWQAEVFEAEGTIALWPILTGMCLLACIVSLVRMLMAKFTGRSHDLGLLRAFGARRRALMGQLLLEAALVGLIAGVGGLLVGTATMPLASSTITAEASVTVISVGDALVTLGAAVGSALAAALYPAWHLSRGTPAAQLRRA
jgi:putative ABC transport system permease protein